MDLDKLLSMPPAEFVKMLPSRLRRRFDRQTLTKKHQSLLKRLRKAKKEAKPAPGELHARPAAVKVRRRSQAPAPSVAAPRSPAPLLTHPPSLSLPRPFAPFRCRPPPLPIALHPAAPPRLAPQTHLRNMPILPEMVGAVVGVFSGKVFNVVEIKPEMIGKYLAEFSITYKPTLHGRPGLGATHSSRFIPLK